MEQAAPCMHVTPFTALLGLWLVAPSVTLHVVDGEGAATTPAAREQLHGLLALRMLDKGIEVVPPGTPAQIVLELRVFADRFVLRADARGSHTAEVSRSDPGTAELALCHGAVLAIAAVAPRDEAERPIARPRSLALEIRGSNVSAAADALRLSLVSHLLTRGWTLTAERASARPTLCIDDAGELVTVAYGPPGRPCGSSVVFARRADADDDATREQIVGAAVALSERPDPPAPSPRLPDTAFIDEAREALGSAVVRPPVEPPALAAPARLGVELRAAAGLALRAGMFERAPLEVDPAVRLGVRIGRAPGLAGQIVGVLLPSRFGRSHRALDGFVGGGLAHSWRLRGRWELELGGLIGAHMHVLRAPASAGGEIGATPWGELAVVAAWRSRGGWAIHGGLHPAASWTSGWVYYVDDASGSARRFQRSGWSMTFSLGISHGWRVR
jgi:hypothetical protein